MRILFLSNFYPPYELGGYSQWCHEVATLLQERGHKIHVLTSRHGVDPAKNKNEKNVTRSLHLEANINYYRPLDFFLTRSRKEKENILEFGKIIKQFKPDIIFVWGMWNLSFNLPKWAETQMPERVAYFISSYWPADKNPHLAYWQLPANRKVTEWAKRPFRNMALRQLQKEGYPPELRFAHAVCCSEYVRNTLAEANKLPAKAGVLYGGTNPEPFLRNADTGENNRDTLLRLLYFGRLIPDKGVHTAIQALGLLKQHGLVNNIKLTVLGSGHPVYEATLQKMVTQLDINDQVQFVAQVSRDEIPQWLGQFDVYLFTSIWPEPMARSVMEAMASGLLVIGTEVGGQTEMLTNEHNALTFQAEDAECLANHIARAADNPKWRQQLAHAGQQLVLEKFTLTRMVDDIETFLKDLRSWG